MRQDIIILKKELIILILLKAILVYLITILDSNNIVLFTWQGAFLHLIILILFPLILFRIISQKSGVELSLRHFILLGFIICISSSFLRVFILDKFMLKMIFDNWFYDSQMQVVSRMSFLQRTQEFTKFALTGIFFYIVVGIVKYKNVSQQRPSKNGG